LSELCVTDHGDSDRRALPGLRLCGGCHDRLARDLADLPALHDRLGDHLGTGGGTALTGRVSGTSAAPLPINPSVADHRDQIRHDLVWWAIHVADERGHALPADTVQDVAAWLGRHVEWIAATLPAAEECPGVMRALVGRAHALLDPNRKLATGERCRVVPEGAERCAGVISMVQGSDETWTARCTVCGPQSAAPYLHDKVAGRWVTLDRVRAYALRAHGVRAERATIRSWAARGRVQTRTEADTTWYDLGSVQRYLTERERMAG
jgi:hypothetical protein